MRPPATLGSDVTRATGERLTERSFANYRKQGGVVIMHMIPEPIVAVALAHPLVLIEL